MTRGSAHAASAANEKRLQRGLHRLRGQRVVVIGDLLLDTYVYGETVRVSREAPVIVVRREREEHRPGGAANTVLNLLAVGAEVHVVGLVGDDEAGEEICGRLAATGAEIEAVHRGPRITPRKTRILAGASGTSRQQVLRLDDEPSLGVDPALAAVLAGELRARAEAADAIAVSDYGLGTLTPLLRETVRGLAAASRLVVVDSRHDLREYHGVTAVTPNRPEAEAVCGRVLRGRAEVEGAGRQLLDELGVSACLLTLGKEGMTLFRRAEASAHVDALGEGEVTDVTGAGDTVLALFTGALCAGLGMVNAMRLANAAAGVVVQKVGTAIATPAEITQSGVELEPWDAS